MQIRPIQQDRIYELVGAQVNSSGCFANSAKQTNCKKTNKNKIERTFFIIEVL